MGGGVKRIDNIYFGKCSRNEKKSEEIELRVYFYFKSIPENEKTKDTNIVYFGLYVVTF